MPDFLQKSKVGHCSISFFTVLFTMYSRTCVSVLFQDLELRDPEILTIINLLIKIISLIF